MKWRKIAGWSLCCMVFWGCKWTADRNERKLMKHAVIWDENRKINWQDFKGGPNPRSDANFYFYCGLYLKYYYSFFKLNYKVLAFFDTEKSWLRDSTGIVLQEKLKWEQLRFDMYEYHVRMLRKDLQISEDSDLSLRVLLDKGEACHNAAENSYYRLIDSLGGQLPEKYDIAEAYIDSLLTVTEFYRLSSD